MNTSESAHSAPIIPLPAPDFKRMVTRRRLILTACFLLILVSVIFLYFASPTNQLARARVLWASNGYPSYRIAVKYEIPLYKCEQDFEVRDETITYRHKDDCSVTPVAGSQGGLFEPMLVSTLFDDIAANLNNPPCGPNGCLCDGPVGVEVNYDPERGYPLKIVYRLMPELRWRNPDYWVAQLTGKLSCLSSGKGSTGGEEIITVSSLTALIDKKPPTGGLGNLLTPEATQPVLPND